MGIGAAFVVPVGMHKGDKYLYFGVEKKTNEVSAFGGKREQKESVEECAVRELHEESHGVFIKDKTLLKKLHNKTKHGVLEATVHNVTKVFFVPVKPNGNPIKRFDKENNKKGLKHYQKEMTKVVAMKAQDVTKIVQTTMPQTPMYMQGHVVRPLIANALRTAVANKFF
jgi:hypothetical protein